jgi:hypothetical protein
MFESDLATSDILNLFTPWVVFGVVVFLLARSQFWIRQHLFGIGLIWLNSKGTAAWVYILVLLPGILLREISRWVVAGIFRIKPTFITPKPQIDADGIVGTRVFHFASLNPIYIGIIAITPLVVGFTIMFVISYGVLNLPQVLLLLGSADSVALREAVGTLLARPDLPLWVYVLFAVTNTMLPTTSELRSTWFIWVIFGAFILFLAVLGMVNAILMILAGPVATAMYTLSAIYGSVLIVNLVMLLVIGVVESIVSRMTNKKVEYQPKPPEPKRSALDAPRSIYDVRLPTPPPPGRALAAGAALKLGMGKVTPEGELPARASGTDLPAVPPKAAPPEPAPARQVPPPPARQQPAASPPPLSAAPRQTGTQAAAKPLPPPPQRAEPPAPTPAKPPPLASPARQTGAQPTQTARPPSGTLGAFASRPITPAPKPKPQEDDVIEGEVIESKDDNDLKYVPADEA